MVDVDQVPGFNSNHTEEDGDILNLRVTDGDAVSLKIPTQPVFDRTLLLHQILKSYLVVNIEQKASLTKLMRLNKGYIKVLIPTSKMGGGKVLKKSSEEDINFLLTNAMFLREMRISY